MMQHLLNYKTPSAAYRDILTKLLDLRHKDRYTASPRAMETTELRDVIYTTEACDDAIVTYDDDRNAAISRYYAAERELYDSCTNSAADFAAHSRFWDKIKNPDDTVNSAYGHLIFRDASERGSWSGKEPVTPWQWAMHALYSDRDTRQAVLRFNKPTHAWVGNKDFVCTMHGVFHIRNDVIHLTMVQRSCDVYYGLVYDLPWFCSLVLRAAREYNATGRKPVKPGLLTHFIHSLHMYERNAADCARMAGLDKTGL